MGEKEHNKVGYLNPLGIYSKDNLDQLLDYPTFLIQIMPLPVKNTFITKITLLLVFLLNAILDTHSTLIFIKILNFMMSENALLLKLTTFF